MTNTTDTRTDTDKLESVRGELRVWRGLAHTASLANNAPSFGRCNRRIERLERVETALVRRIARNS